MGNADDGGLVDDAEIAAVEAAGGGAEHELLARAQAQAPVPARQRASSAITRARDRCRPAVDRDGATKAADTVAGDARDVEAHVARWSGLLQADAYGGYNRLYVLDRKPGLILEAACWAHARRPFFAAADIEASTRRKAEGKVPAPISPMALEIVQRIDRLFEIERGINGNTADERRAVRQALSRPLVDELEALMRAERPKLSRGSDLAKAMDYILKRWPAFTRFLDDGRVCLSNNAAERGLRGIALGRKSWLFAGSDRGGMRAAAMYSLIVTAKMNNIDPQAWLADVLARIAELLPWNWRSANDMVVKAA